MHENVDKGLLQCIVGQVTVIGNAHRYSKHGIFVLLIKKPLCQAILPEALFYQSVLLTAIHVVDLYD